MAHAPHSQPYATFDDVDDNMDEETQERVADMLSEGGASYTSELAVRSAPQNDHDLSPADLLPDEGPASPPGAFSAFVERKAARWGADRLKTLVARKGRVSESMGEIPANMHRVASQTRLILELIDDFRDGTYREISWRSIALLVGALLYAVSPMDVIPDTIPLLGGLDDLTVVAIVTRLVQGDLRRYCAFKGYPLVEYFRLQDSHQTA